MGRVAVWTHTGVRWREPAVEASDLSCIEIAKYFEWDESEAPCTFTLLDILGEIYWEISFCGSPENRDRRRAELWQCACEVEEGRRMLIPGETPDGGVN